MKTCRNPTPAERWKACGKTIVASNWGKPKQSHNTIFLSNPNQNQNNKKSTLRSNNDFLNPARSSSPEENSSFGSTKLFLGVFFCLDHTRSIFLNQTVGFFKRIPPHYMAHKSEVWNARARDRDREQERGVEKGTDSFKAVELVQNRQSPPRSEVREGISVGSRGQESS